MDSMLYYRMDSTALPAVKYVDKVTVEPPHVHIRRQLEEFVLYYVLSGEMCLSEDDRQYVLQPNDMVILDPGREHYGTRSTACTYYYVHFYHQGTAECSGPMERLKDDLVDGRLASLQTKRCDIREVGTHWVLLPKHMHIAQSGAAIRLIDTLQRLRASHHDRLEYYTLNTGAIFLEFLIAISRELTSSFLYCDNTASTTRSTRMVHDLLSFFQGNYDTEITGQRIEEAFHCNYDYLNRMFKKATGTTILAYLNELRIFKARQLLGDGTSRICEVAERCGFRDIYYFTKVFKKYTGSTPGAYSRRSGA